LEESHFPHRSRAVKVPLCECPAAVNALMQTELPVSSEMSDLLYFVSYFATQSKGMKFGDNFFDVCCVN